HGRPAGSRLDRGPVGGVHPPRGAQVPEGLLRLGGPRVGKRPPAHVRRPPSVLGRLARTFVPGVRLVQGQVARYAALWDDDNTAALSAGGPLWVALGDSTAQGIGAPTYDQGYVGQLRRRLDGAD